MSAVAPNPITTPRSVDELTKLAGSQIDAEIKGQVDPLQGQIGTLQGRETSALQGVGSLFGTLQPFVSGEADKVTSTYDQAHKASESIFNAAQQRMSQLKQSRAQEAQAMAQEIGGPVSVGEFTASVLPQEQELASVAPNALLHQLANAEAGSQEARAFSEKVFPLARTEQEAKTKGFFEDQIKTLGDEIAKIQGTKGGLMDSRLNDLLTQERSFGLQKAQQQLDKLKANRDWQATIHSLHNDDSRLKLAKDQSALQTAGVTGTYKGKPTLQALKYSIAEKQAQERLNISQASLDERVRRAQETSAIQQQRIKNQTQRNAMGILDNAMSPSTKPTLTLTHKVYIDPKTSPGLIGQAISGKLKDAHRDPKTGRWYYYGKQTLTTQQAIAQGYNLGGDQPITNPQDLYNLLVGSGTPSAMALNLVRTRTGIGDFTPGKDTNYTPESLALMTNKELMGIARARGYKGNGKRNDLVHYIAGG